MDRDKWNQEMQILRAFFLLKGTTRNGSSTVMQRNEWFQSALKKQELPGNMPSDGPTTAQRRPIWRTKRRTPTGPFNRGERLW